MLFRPARSLVECVQDIYGWYGWVFLFMLHPPTWPRPLHAHSIISLAQQYQDASQLHRWVIIMMMIMMMMMMMMRISRCVMV